MVVHARKYVLETEKERAEIKSTCFCEQCNKVSSACCNIKRTKQRKKRKKQRTKQRKKRKKQRTKQRKKRKKQRTKQRKKRKKQRTKREQEVVSYVQEFPRI